MRISAYLMIYCQICIFKTTFETKCNTKNISLNMKIKLVEIHEDIFKRKKKIPFTFEKNGKKT